MPLSNPYMCRGLTPLLNDNDNPTDQQIMDNILDVESDFGLAMANKYVDPFEPVSYLSGTITVNKGSKVITGTSTAFTNLKPNQVIQIVKTGEAVQIERIDSDASLTVFSNVVSDSVDSEFWIVPRSLVAASKWQATHMTIMLHFPEKTINQDNIEKFDNRLEKAAGNIIRSLKDGTYQNTDLKQQVASKSSARLLSTNTNNVVRTMIDTNNSLFTGNGFV